MDELIENRLLPDLKILSGDDISKAVRAERAAPNTDSHGERRKGVEECFHGGSVRGVVVLGYRDFQEGR